MPYTVKLHRPPAGYSTTTARGGEQVSVLYREFVSFEDGETLISRLEGFPTSLLQKIPDSEISPSKVDHLFAIIYGNGGCQVFVNECNIIAKTRVRRSVKKGDAVYESDIVDCEEVEFEGVSVPPEAGILIVFSMGWRKGLFYDFGPLQSDPIFRDYSIWKLLGALHNYLFFQEYFKITDVEYSQLFEKLWFPFIGLKKETTQKLLNYVRSGRDPDELTEHIEEELRSSLENMLLRWKQHPLLAEHSDLLDRACERFLDGDKVSCSAIVYPRIEGILRAFSRSTDREYKQSELARVPSEHGSTISVSRVLPDKFVKYLKEVYFRSFDPDNPDHISRNTVGHGVAPQSLYNTKSACIGLLIVEQIYLQLPVSSSANEV